MRFDLQRRDLSLCWTPERIAKARRFISIASAARSGLR
jgi:hypothetical protein